MSAPGCCDCGHYWTVHRDGGCTGWLSHARYPRWARVLRDTFRLLPLLRCKCPWEFHKLDIPAVTEEER